MCEECGLPILIDKVKLAARVGQERVRFLTLILIREDERLLLSAWVGDYTNEKKSMRLLNRIYILLSVQK